MYGKRRPWTIVNASHPYETVLARNCRIAPLSSQFERRPPKHIQQRHLFYNQRLVELNYNVRITPQMRRNYANSGTSVWGGMVTSQELLVDLEERARQDFLFEASFNRKSLGFGPAFCFGCELLVSHKARPPRLAQKKRSVPRHYE